MYNLKRMKKLLAVLTIFVFLAGIANTGFAPAALAASSDSSKSSSSSVDVVKLTSDITDKDTKEAVLRLAAFAIVNGMEDGKYHPGDKVTREQFAKILVTALKMDTAAKAATGRSSFKDVEANRWSVGYINVAAGQGLINGYPDGTFKPANEVSYAEAITMLVRALGYRDNMLSGNWPGNYLAKAAEKEITKHVAFSDSTGVSNRGDVAILVNNTLDAKVVKVDTYESSGAKYVESDETLLENKLNITKYENTRITADRRIDDGLEEDEIRVKFLKDTEDDKYDENEERDFDMVYGVNVENVLGEEGTVYLNDDDEVVYAEQGSDDKAYFDYIEGVEMDSKDKNVEKLSLVKADDDYAFDDDAVIYIMDDDTYKLTDPDEVDDVDKLLGKVGKFVIKNNKIVWAEIMSSDETNPWMVVTDNSGDMLKGIVGDDDEYDIDLKEGNDYDGIIVLDLEGNRMDVDDIEKGNLVYIQKQDVGGDDYAVVRVVNNNTIEGKLSSVKDDRIELDDKETKLVKYTDKDGNKDYQAYYSVNDGEDISLYDLKDSDVADDMEDADEENIIAYTDAVGRIAYFVTASESSSGYKYGVVTKTYADGDKVKIFTIDGEGEGDEITYDAEEDDNLTSGGAYKLNEYGQKTKDAATVKVGSPVKFKLNKEGEIAEDELYVMDTANVWKINSGDDFGKDYLPKAYLYEKYEYDKDNADGSGAYIKASGSSETKTFSVEDDVTIIDAEGYKFKEEKDSNGDVIGLAPTWADTDDFSEGKWKDLSDSNGINGYMYVFADDNNKAKAKAAIFIGKGSGSAANDEIGIYVIDYRDKGGDRIVEYQSYGGDVEERTLDDNDSLYNGDESPYVAKVKSNGDLQIVEPKVKGTDDDFTVYYGIVDKRSSDELTLEEGFKPIYLDSKGNIAFGSSQDKAEFSISSKTVIYEEDTKKTTSNIRNGDAVIIVVEKGSNVRVIERLIDSEKEKCEDIVGGSPTPTPGDIDTATISESPSTTVAVTVYADGINWSADTQEKAKTYTVSITRTGIKAETYTARTTESRSYDDDDNSVTFTAIFEDKIYDGDKLTIEDKAITVTAKDSSGNVLQTQEVDGPISLTIEKSSD